MTATDNSSETMRAARCTYGAMIIALLVGAYFPQYRIWGLSSWAHYPFYVPLIFTALGVFIGLWECRRTKTLKAQEQGKTTAGTDSYVLWAAATAVVFVALFVLLHARTHFLGDGSLLLGELAKGNDLIKPVEFGEARLHLWIRNLAGGANPDAALLSYQIISIGAGICFALVAAIGAARLFSSLKKRLIFLLGLLTGGYALMFFGYVENYSLLCLSILIFALTGLLATRGQISRWWILAPLALATCCHLLGGTLVVPAVYVLLSGTALAGRVTRLGTIGRLLGGAVVVLAAGFVFGYLYRSNFYFRFAFLPLTQNQFTPGGYTLVSPAHIADLVNLILLLVPGCLIGIVAVNGQGWRTSFRSPATRFLVFMTAASLAAVCLLDPKLGMPRDWDLFSFPGVPVTALLLWLLLDRDTRGESSMGAAILVVALGALSLFPRAVSQAIPANGVALLRNYVDLDPARGRTAQFALNMYFMQRGDTSEAMSYERQRHASYPYEDITRRAVSAFGRDDVRGAKVLAEEAISQNGTYSAAWVVLAKCLISERKLDSAEQAIRIADGLNPQAGLTQNVMGLIDFSRGDIRSAEERWRRWAEQDSADYTYVFGLAQVYRANGDSEKYRHYLVLSAFRPNAPVEVMLELAQTCLGAGNRQQALVVCREALARGLDTAAIEGWVRQHPEVLDSQMPPGKS